MLRHELLPDIVISKRSAPVLSVLVDNQPGWTADEAADYMTRLTGDDGALRDTSRSGLLMLLSQDVAFVWRVEPASPLRLSLVAQASVAFIFDEYSRRAGIRDRRLYGSTLRMLAVDWLSRMRDGFDVPADRPPELVRIGLIDAIRDGTLAWQVDAD